MFTQSEQMSAETAAVAAAFAATQTRLEQDPSLAVFPRISHVLSEMPANRSRKVIIDDDTIVAHEEGGGQGEGSVYKDPWPVKDTNSPTNIRVSMVSCAAAADVSGATVSADGLVGSADGLVCEALLRGKSEVLSEVQFRGGSREVKSKFDLRVHNVEEATNMLARISRCKVRECDSERERQRDRGSDIARSRRRQMCTQTQTQSQTSIDTHVWMYEHGQHHQIAGQTEIERSTDGQGQSRAHRERLNVYGV